jgi:transketolase
MGAASDIIETNLAHLWIAAGWRTIRVDGHNIDELLQSLRFNDVATQPLAVVAKTVLGKGVSFMENRLEWHYRNLTSELASEALNELTGEEHS